MTRRPLSAGEKVLLLDRKARRYLVTLVAGGQFHSHAGWVSHDELIVEEEGVTARSTAEAWFQAVRPALSDFVVMMRRGAQVI